MTFAFLVFLSGSSFIVGLHYCGGKVRDVALFSKAEDCQNEKQLPPCHRHETPPCCQDEEVLHEGQGFQHSTSQIDISSLSIAETISPAVLVSEIINADAGHVRYTFYEPPLRTCDLTVSLQVFLI